MQRDWWYVLGGTLLLVGCAAPSARGELMWYWDGPASTPAATLQQITSAMDEAVAYYNAHAAYDWPEYSTDSRGVRVIYSASVPTANANYRSRIAFGGSIGVSTAMHELSHVFGVGTYEPIWTAVISGGKWQGSVANVLLEEFDGGGMLSADDSHFWPYGLNYSTEDSIENRRRHVRMVGALRADMRLRNGNASEVLGDYNNDGVTDAADYTVWRDRLGSATSLVNDQTIGSVDPIDYAWWSRGFGQTATSSAATAVPEPTALALLVAASALIIARRR